MLPLVGVNTAVTGHVHGSIPSLALRAVGGGLGEAWLRIVGPWWTGAGQ
ncbi:hypothetical protein AG1IA_00361 [Rhizoctonia solani AG-1 IA]|uniref:Uncharacterized protein n=1 Tax=Thanatephorus cucumeris (strain AG1-IA) TaxID=983506 RepID=L8X5K7_THACA|nr:hypothetical protein AG1IA_00361 [Rhizoctonia solani AG-1 IA]